MRQETKIKLFRFLAKLFFGKDCHFNLTNKGWLESVAREANIHPNSKILVLKILRLDGSTLDEAMKKYTSMNS